MERLLLCPRSMMLSISEARRRPSFAACALAALVATAGCGDDDALQTTGTGGQGGSGAGGAGATGGEGGGGGLTQPSSALCDRIEPGPAGVDSFPVALSAAHASVRFFGPHDTHREVDEALADALDGQDALSEVGLQAYADALGDEVCVRPATEATALGPATAERVGDVLLVTPGSGTLELPSLTGVTVVGLDLRHLPAGVDVTAALQTATEALLDAPLDAPSAMVRRHDGMTDEVFGPLTGLPNNVYTDAVVEVIPPAWPAGVGTGVPLAVLTDAQLAPEAARLAIALRLDTRAHIVGEDVLTAVAESRWLGVGSSGIVHRDRLLGGADPLPDVIRADVRTADPVAALPALVAEALPPLALDEPATRSGFTPFSSELAITDDVHDLGSARAAVIVAHGAARLFFPYFETVGDTLDAGLEQSLAGIETTRLQGAARGQEALRRLGAHLHDAHVYTFYLGDEPILPASAPVFLDIAITDDVLIRKSSLPGAPVGHAIVAVNGTPVLTALEAFDETVSAGTPTALMREKLTRLKEIHSPTTWTLRSPEGVESDLLLDPTTLPAAPASLHELSTRTHGSLADLGHPAVYYINLDAEAYDGNPTADQLIANASGHEALILDGRGYPGTIEAWQVVMRLLDTSSSVRFNTPVHSAVESSLAPSQQAWPALTPTFDGPVYALIAPHSQSQAEHVFMALKSTASATFVGRQTAGANGNITGVMVPGAFGFTFTGLEVLFEDDSTFHGVGILPDVVAGPDAVGLAAGEDPELEAALALIDEG